MVMRELLIKTSIFTENQAARVATIRRSIFRCSFILKFILFHSILILNLFNLLKKFIMIYIFLNSIATRFFL